MTRQLEHQLHCAFHDWYMYQPKTARYMFCLEHGELRNPVVGAKLKRKGVRKGMADYLYLKPNSQFTSLWIEFKVGKNKQSPSQKEFQKVVEESGGLYICCWSLEEAIEQVKRYDAE